MYFLFRQTSKRVSSFGKLRIKPTPKQISTKAPRILCDNLSGILSDIYSDNFWHTIWDLSGILSDILSEARGSCGSGPHGSPDHIRVHHAVSADGMLTVKI